MVRRVVARAAALEAQQARQAAAGRLAARHQERLAQLAAQAVVHPVVVHPVGGPAQLWAAPLGADQRQWVHLGPVQEELEALAVIPDRGLWQVVPPAPVELPDLNLVELGARWAQVLEAAHPVGERLGEQVHQAMQAWYPQAAQLAQLVEQLAPGVASPSLVELGRQEEDRCPVGLARSGLAGVLVPRLSIWCL